MFLSNPCLLFRFFEKNCLTNPRLLFRFFEKKCLLFRFLPFLAHISQTTQARPPLNCIFRVSRRISRRFVYLIPYFKFHRYLKKLPYLTLFFFSLLIVNNTYLSNYSCYTLSN